MPKIGKAFIWIWLTSPKAENISLIHYEADMTTHGWVLLEKREIEATIPEPAVTVPKFVSNIDAAIDKVNLEAAEKIQELQKQRAAILQIAYTPPPAPQGETFVDVESREVEDLSFRTKVREDDDFPF